MKSIFKRTLATATGSVLALSQLLSVANVNISAADTKTLKIDAASILSVPFEETNPLAAHQSSDWADKVESKFIELGSHDFSYSSQKIKNQIAKTLKKNGFAKYMSSEDVDALVAKIDKEVKGHTEPDGSFSASISYDDMGDVIGDIMQKLYTNSGEALKDDAGNPIVIDWSAFDVKGKIVVEGKFDFENKTVDYTTKVVDELGGKQQTYEGKEGIEQFVRDKLDQGTAVAANAPKGSAKKFNDQLTKNAEAMSKRIDYISEIADAIKDIVLPEGLGEIEIAEEIETSYPDAETAYGAYMLALNDAIGKADIPESVAERVKNAVAKRAPQSVDAAVSSERFTTFFEKAVEVLNRNDQGVEIDITVDDARSIYSNSYDRAFAFLDGYSPAVSFKYEDAENAEILDAVKAVYTDDGFITGADLKTLAEMSDGETYQLYDVVDASGAVVTDFDKNYTVIGVDSYKTLFGMAITEYGVKGMAYFDVVRDIDAIIVEEVKETTTSTTTSTTTTSTTTTTIDTTTDTTTTTLATYVSFEVGAQGQNELIYWSEETDATFDFSEIQITAHFVVAGEDQKEQTVDVSSYFSAAANSPAELGVKPEDVKGVLRKPVDLILKDEAGLRTALATVPGYDVDAIMNDQGFAQGKAISYFNVILVLRGDANLDGEVDAVDAQNALNYYVDSLALKSAKSSITAGRYLNEYENGMSVLRYSHYAADISGDGVIDSFDAQKTLVKYVRWLSLIDKTWDEITGTHFVPKDVLHADPLAYDEPAKKDYQEFIDAQ